MVYDSLDNLARYTALHPALPRIVEFITSGALGGIADGKHAPDGDDWYVSAGNEQGKTRSGARLEAHRKYIDVQLALTGEDLVGWAPLAACTDLTHPYDGQRDIMFYGDAPQAWLPLPPGRFLLLFPDDAHAPLAGEGRVRKAVFKLAVMPAAE